MQRLPHRALNILKAAVQEPLLHLVLHLILHASTCHMRGSQALAHQPGIFARPFAPLAATMRIAAAPTTHIPPR